MPSYSVFFIEQWVVKAQMKRSFRTHYYPYMRFVGGVLGGASIAQLQGQVYGHVWDRQICGEMEKTMNETCFTATVWRETIRF